MLGLSGSRRDCQGEESVHRVCMSGIAVVLQACVLVGAQLGLCIGLARPQATAQERGSAHGCCPWVLLAGKGFEAEPWHCPRGEGGGRNVRR